MDIKSKYLKLHRKINQSYLLRLLLKPFIVLKRKFEACKYKYSEDSMFLRTFKDKYHGQRCFIIGNGPSLSVADLNAIKGEVSFASNRVYKMYDKAEWRPSFYVCIDRQNIIDDIDIIKGMTGSTKFIAHFAKKYGRKTDDEIHYLLIGGKFYVKKLEQIHGGGKVQEDVSQYISSSQSVTCNMIEIAFYMGFKEIYLLGVDHSFPITIDKSGKKTVDKTIPDHFKGGGFRDSSIDFVYYDALTDSYQVLEDYAKTHGIKIYNATRGGKLEVFERIEFEDVMKDR